jgi:hypothetical protein
MLTQHVAAERQRLLGEAPGQIGVALVPDQ